MTRLITQRPKPEQVFGNILEKIPKYQCNNKQNVSDQDLPEFIIRCIGKIEPMIATIGIYRINGDAAAVQKIRYLQHLCLPSNRFYIYNTLQRLIWYIVLVTYLC